MPQRGGRNCAGLSPSERAERLTSDEDVACTGVALEPEGMPVSVYILMDRSISMTYETQGYDSRWDAIHTAVEKFVEHPEAAQIEVGYGMFSLDGGTSETINCNADNFAEPIVPFGLPADVGQDIVDEVANTQPAGLTPTAPALEGAIRYVKEYKRSHPEREAVVMLVTDAYPTLCMADNPISQMAEVAGKGYDDDPSIRTFVMGIEADFNLGQIAMYGGTNDAYILDPEEGDVTTAFVDRLLSLGSSDLACNLELPPPSSPTEEFNPNEVVVTWESPLRGMVEELPKVESEAACESSPFGGWYYRSVEDRQISLCPCSCSRMGSGSITVAAGCTPVTTLG